MSNSDNYVFSQSTASFSKAYPNIVSAKITVTPDKYNSGDGKQQTFTEANISRFIPCGWKTCTGQGYDISSLLYDANQSGTGDGHVQCSGYEGKYKEARRCPNAATVKITAVLKQADAPAN